MGKYYEKTPMPYRFGNFIFGLLKTAAAVGLTLGAITWQRSDALQHLGHKNPAFLWGFGGLAALFALWALRSFVLAIRGTTAAYSASSGRSVVSDTQYTHLLLKEISDKMDRNR